MAKVYMRFEWMAGCRVSFLDGDRVLPRSVVVASEEKLFEMAERGGGLKDLATKKALEHGIRLGRGGMYLELSASQLQNLQRARPSGRHAIMRDTATCEGQAIEFVVEP